MSEQFKVGVITISDRASAGEYEDLGGPAIVSWLTKAVINDMVFRKRIIADEQTVIEKTLIALSDPGEDHCDLILTTGGTGPSPRDVTPEATLAVAEKVLPGFGERMRGISLAYVPTAILSRQEGVIRGKTLIVNLPGSPRSIAEILDTLFEAIPYCIQLIEGPYVETDEKVVTAFRPKHAKKIGNG